MSALSDTLCRSVGDDYNIDCGRRRNLSGCHYFLKGKRKMMTGEIPKGSITVNIPNMAEFEAVVLMDNFEPYYRKEFSGGSIEDCFPGKQRQKRSLACECHYIFLPHLDTGKGWPGHWWHLLTLAILLVVALTALVALMGYYCRSRKSVELSWGISYEHKYFAGGAQPEPDLKPAYGGRPWFE